MNLDSLRKYCATLPGATRDIKWGADEVYSLGGKMFAVFGLEGGRSRALVFAKLTKKEQASIATGAQPPRGKR